MPPLSAKLPKYRKHRPTGRAVVTLNGKDHYLGMHGTNASKTAYDDLVARWLANGRRLPDDRDEVPAITVNELLAQFYRHAKQHYRKNGKTTGTAEGFKPIIRLLRQQFGRLPVGEFRALALQALRDELVESGVSRRYVNDQTQRVRRIFRWGASREIVPVEVVQSLATVSSLEKGRSKAREAAPIQPVDDETVDATLPHCSEVVAAMIRLQRLTGMRPSEVCDLRPIDVNRDGDVWVFIPKEHKTEHHSKARAITIGPKGQAVLLPYLERDGAAYCFSPAEATDERRRKLHASRRTPMNCGTKPQPIDRRRSRDRWPGDHYETDAYRRAIHRACDRAFPPPARLAKRGRESVAKWQDRLGPSKWAELKAWQREHRWSPNQLRHSAATEIRRQFGIEAASVILGHSKVDTTEIYALRNLEASKEIARQVG